MDRKQFLKNSDKGVALTALLPSLAFCSTNGRQKTIPENYQVSNNFEPDVDIELTASPSEQQLFPGTY